MKFSLTSKAVAVTAAATALMLAGCTNGSPSVQGGNAGPAASETQTINVWGWTGAPGTDTMAKIISAFEAEHPNITVEYNEIAQADYKNKATLGLSSKQDIDVIAVQPNAWAANNASYFEPVENWPDSAGLLDKFQPLPLEQEKKLFTDGTIRSVPFGSTGSAVGFYNVDLLKKAGLTEPPKTWDDYKKLAQGLKTAAPGVVPVVMPGDAWFQDEFVLTMVGQKSPEFFNKVRYEDGEWDTSEYRDALAKYKAAYDNGTFDKSTLDMKYADAMSLFDNGKAAVVFNGSWEAGRLLADYRTKNKVQASDVGVVAVPADNASDASTRSFLDLTYGIPTASENKAAAAEFIEFTTTRKGIDVWGPSLGFVPAAKDWTMPTGVLTSDAAQQGYKQLQDLIANPHGDRNNLSNLSDQVGGYVLDVVRGTKSPEDAAKQGQDDLKSGKYN